MTQTEPVCPGPALCAKRRMKFLHWNERQAVLPWVRTALQLAQASEDDVVYRSTLATYERLLEECQEMVDALWEIDHAWTRDVLGNRGPACMPSKVDPAKQYVNDSDEEEADL